MARGHKNAAVKAEPVEGLWGLPDGWNWERLGQCGDWSSGGTPSAKVARYYDGSIPWLTSGELNDGVVSVSAKTITDEGYANSSVKWVPTGTLLVAMYGATIGKAAVTGFRCTTNQAVAACQPHPEHNVRYLLYYVLSQRDNLRKLGQGGAQPNISQALLKDYPCPIAPRDDQDAMVARIDALFAEIDEGEAALAEARAGVETYRKALLKAAVTGELTADWRASNPPQETGEQLLARILADRRARWHAEPKNARKKYTEPAGPDTDGLPELPEGWAWASAEQLSAGSKGDIVIGPFGSDLKVSDYRSEGVPLVFVRHIRAQEFLGLRPQFVTPEKAEALRAHEAVPGDLLITKMGDPPGDIATYPELPTAIITADCIRWRPTQSVEARFLEIWVRSFWGRAWIAQKTKGVAQQKITLEIFRQMPVALPSMVEQREIVLRSIEAQSSVDDLASGDVAALPSSLRQSILAAAFRGELAA